jgi:hypothetical protein
MASTMTAQVVELIDLIALIVYIYKYNIYDIYVYRAGSRQKGVKAVNEG